MKMNISQILIVSTLVCFPGFRQGCAQSNPRRTEAIAEAILQKGQNALFSLTTGSYNTAVGLYSLLSLSDTRFNTGVGAGTLPANTSDENTAIGAGALLNEQPGGRGKVQPLERLSLFNRYHRQPKIRRLEPLLSLPTRKGATTPLQVIRHS